MNMLERHISQYSQLFSTKSPRIDEVAALDLSPLRSCQPAEESPSSLTESKFAQRSDHGDD